MDAERPSFIAGGGNHAALIRITADDDGLAAPSGMVQLFDGCEECIQVNQQNCWPVPYGKYEVSLVFALFRIQDNTSSGLHMVMQEVC